VAVTHNSPRPAPSAATNKSQPVTRLPAPPKSKILIANPRLEFPPTHTKQTPLTFSNREYIAVFHLLPPRLHFKNRPRPRLPLTPGRPTSNAGVPPALLTHGRAFRTAGIPAGSFDLSPLITHLPAVAKPPCRFLPLASHKSPVTNHDFLIYGPAIRIPRKP
jgi:hypothetical protein